MSNFTFHGIRRAAADARHYGGNTRCNAEAIDPVSGATFHCTIRADAPHDTHEAALPLLICATWED